MKRPKKLKAFATEADLCAAFIASLPPGWTAYAETAGWDILLVRRGDGFQIGIQAKLRLNAHVLSQAIEEYGPYSAELAGPDCRAVLVPGGEAGGFHTIAQYIGITIIPMLPRLRDRYHTTRLPGEPHASEGDWHEWLPHRRHKLPEYVPDVPAGASAPVQLTRWKIGAIKIMITLERRGYVTRQDFKHIGIDHRRWLTSGLGWLMIQNGRYVATTLMPSLRKTHPRVYAEIERDIDKWMLSSLPPSPVLL